MNFRQTQKAVWITVFLCSPVFAMDAAASRYMKQLNSGNPLLVREAAKSIYRAGYHEESVLDAAASVLLKGLGTEDTDAMAWLCRALGNSGDSRYRPAVTQAAASGNHKLQRHCGRAADKLALLADTVSIARAGASEKMVAAIRGDFSTIAIGMSADEAERLAGLPTTLTTRMTDHRFSSFHSRNRNDTRQFAFYKGKGIIVYSKSRYDSRFRVIDVIEDASEPGHPVTP